MVLCVLFEVEWVGWRCFYLFSAWDYNAIVMEFNVVKNKNGVIWDGLKRPCDGEQERMDSGIDDLCMEFMKWNYAWFVGWNIWYSIFMHGQQYEYCEYVESCIILMYILVFRYVSNSNITNIPAFYWRINPSIINSFLFLHFNGVLWCICLMDLL